MAITLITIEPLNEFEPANSPLFIQGETNRTAPAGKVTITNVQSSPGGKVWLTVADNTGIVPGYVVNIDDCSTDFNYLRGRHNITNIVSGKLELEIDYVAPSTTGLKGTIEVLLSKFSMHLSYTYGTTAERGEEYYVPFINQKAIKDIDTFLRARFRGSFSLTDGWHSMCDYGYLPVTVSIVESILDKDYNRIDLDTPQSVTFGAVRSTNIDNRLLETGTQAKLLNGTNRIKVHTGNKVILSMLAYDRDVNVYYSYSDGITNTSNTVPFTSADNMGFYVWQVPAGARTAHMFITNIEGDRISEILNIDILGGSGTNTHTLYWLNRFGGYDMYEFPQAVETLDAGNKYEFRHYTSQTSTQIDTDYSTRAYTNYKLIGRAEDSAHLRDIITSPEVYDQAGNPVKVITTEFKQGRELTLPEFIIQSNIINSIYPN